MTDDNFLITCLEVFFILLLGMCLVLLESSLVILPDKEATLARAQLGE